MSAARDPADPAELRRTRDALLRLDDPGPTDESVAVRLDAAAARIEQDAVEEQYLADELAKARDRIEELTRERDEARASLEVRVITLDAERTGEIEIPFGSTVCPTHGDIVHGKPAQAATVPIPRPPSVTLTAEQAAQLIALPEGTIYTESNPAFGGHPTITTPGRCHRCGGTGTTIDSCGTCISTCQDCRPAKGASRE